MIESDSTFYATNTTGSKLLEPLVDKIGLPIDKINFLASQLLFILLSLLYKRYLTKQSVSSNARHWYMLLPSLLIGYFCFGFELLNLVLMASINYSLILFCSPDIIQTYTLAASMIYLSCLHVARMVYDSGNYTYDITAPAMIMVQKMTMLGYSLHDGSRERSQLLQGHERVAIRKMPNFLEYFSFVLCFPSFLSGPCFHYHDYIEFIELTSYSKHISVKNFEVPSSTSVWLEKLSTSLFFALLTLIFNPMFPMHVFADNEFLKKDLITILTYMFLATTCFRFKYYFSWKIGESHLNCCGFGFSGFDEKTKKAKYDLLSSMNIIPYELAPNLKVALDHWNVSTQKWLRFVMYERASDSHKLISTFLLSAAWHGFYFGYYVAFLSLALFTKTARLGKKYIRPIFRPNSDLKFFYDLTVFLSVKFVMAYSSLAFVLLDFHKNAKFFSRIYFMGHLASLLLIFVIVPMIRKHKDEETEGKKDDEVDEKDKKDNEVDKKDKKD